MAIAAAVAVVIGALAAGIQWAVSSAIAPLYAEMRGINDRIDGLDKRMDRMDSRMGRMESQLEILPELRERLTRLETILLERDREAP